ncbi:hypothetical protein FO488_00275 [Geobacter sp. FeAm09]|uniref:hypothetical protein n=1 Tax=Geobacter sp. FeAm09 TaxID=2597769 RepID=UPI0011EF51CB|nr:hypothetical protein [Geobacter sp. FeAm09]QEM66742.1 hypothetical protein FO488_00275 [Geobacter sp. FeAm09]
MLKDKIVVSGLMIVVVMMLGGCGSSFKNVNSVCIEGPTASSISAPRRVGVLVVGSKTKKSTKIAERHLVGALRDSGLNAHAVEQSSAVGAFLMNYGALGRSTAEGINSPCTANLGNLNKIFEDEGIDTLIAYDGTEEGEATVFGTLVGFADAAANVGLSAATRTVIPRSTPAKQTYNAVTVNHISIITPDGKISRYVSGVLPRQNERLYESERVEIAKQLSEIIISKEPAK